MKLALAGLCALLAGVIWLELEPAVAPPAAPVAPARVGLPPESTHAFAALDSFAEIVERTLFEPARRPPPEEAGAAPLAAELRELSLTGIVITPEEKLALLHDKEPLRLRLGASVGDWVLVEVRKDGILLRRGTATRELLLHEKAAP